MKKKQKLIEIPDLETLEAELERLENVARYKSVLRSIVCTLAVVSAIMILITTLVLPFLRIYGTSMTPTLENGNIVACVKATEFKTGDIVAFYYNNKILVKRVIGRAGDIIEVKEDGTVYVNDSELYEPYISQKSLGECDIAMPFQVPEDALFVMGDHRDASIDSRSSTIGCVLEEQIAGKVAVRIWPLNRIRIFY